MLDGGELLLFCRRVGCLLANQVLSRVLMGFYWFSGLGSFGGHALHPKPAVGCGKFEGVFGDNLNA